MTVTIQFETDNAAFEDDIDAECVRIIRSAAFIIDTRGLDASDDVTLRDYNGNRVGQIQVSE